MAVFFFQSRGGVIRRHNSIRDAIFVYAKKSGFKVSREKMGLIGDVGDQRRPADVLIENFSLSRDHCLDVAVTSPVQPTYLRHAANTPGFAASDYSAFKNAMYKQEVEDSGTKVFVPMVVETYGRWSDTALEVLKAIARARSNHDSSFISLTESLQSLFQSLSFALIRRNVEMILDRLPC